MTDAEIRERARQVAFEYLREAVPISLYPFMVHERGIEELAAVIAAAMSEAAAGEWKHVLKFYDEHLRRPDENGCSCEGHRILREAAAQARLEEMYTVRAKFHGTKEKHRWLNFPGYMDERIAELERAVKESK